MVEENRFDKLKPNLLSVIHQLNSVPEMILTFGSGIKDRKYIQENDTSIHER